jgi:hypothetical protein
MTLFFLSFRGGRRPTRTPLSAGVAVGLCVGAVDEDEDDEGVEDSAADAGAGACACACATASGLRGTKPGGRVLTLGARLAAWAAWADWAARRSVVRIIVGVVLMKWTVWT